jgi:cytoskeletal protein CcmA (bactofilin family)
LIEGFTVNRFRRVLSTLGAPLFLGLLVAGDAWAQTNPTAQSLPYTQDFSGLAHTSTTYPAGWQGWKVSSSSSSSFRTDAPTADHTLIASSSASTDDGGVHNYNGKIGILASGSTNPALCLAINTTGHSNVTVAFDIMTIRNPYNGTTNTRINQVDLQYRVGTSGSFTSVSGSASGIYESNTTAQTGSGVTTPQKLEAKSFTLPSACDNQATVQLRWVQRDVTGMGSRPSFAVDNISVCPGVGAAGTITGSTSVCANATAVSYSISAVSGATTYTWTVPSGASVASGQGTTSITVDWGSTSGNVTVTPSNSCNTGTANSLAITVNQLPTAFNVTGGGSYCSGGTGVAVGLDGSETGVEYQLVLDGTTNVGSPVAGTGSAISFGNQTTAGTYTVVATNTTTLCEQTMTGSATVTINALPIAFNVTGGGSYCSGGTGVPVGLDGSQTGVEYQLVLDGTTNIGSAVAGTGSAISFGNQTTAGTYTVVATNTTTLCQQTMTGSATVTINALPIAFNVTGGGSYCSGGTGVTVGLDGSQTGVEYQLVLDGMTNIGSAVAGTGSAISFGNQTTAGTYTVVATNTTTLCEQTMTGSATVTINPLPTAFNVTGTGASCSGGTGVTVGLDGSQAGVEYQLVLDGTTNVGSPVAGTGSAISFGNQTTAGTYTVVATNTTTLCQQTMTGSATVTINALPIAFNVTGGGSYCSGGTGVTVGLDGSQAGIEYQLVLDGTTNIGSPVAGTGSAISFGNQTTAGTYTVVATNTTTLCEQTMTGSATVTVNPLPTVTFSSVGPFLVTDAAVDLSSSVSPSGGIFSGTGISGTMFDPATAGVGTHTITYTFTDVNGCTNNASQDITVNAAAAAKPFVLLAEEDIQINGQVNSDGDIHANNDIFFNQGNKPNSIHTGNVTASDDIFIKKNNKIVGTVMGDDVENRGTVTGGVTEDAGIAKVPLPVLASLDHGDDDVTVKAGKTLTLPPGDYAEVKVGKKGTLKLASGTYNLECLNLREKAMLVIDLSSGLPITINADEEVIFGKNVVMKLIPSSASTDLITINCDEDDDSDKDFDDDEDDTDRVIIGEGARVFGNIIAPETMVVLDKKSRFKGAICAENVLVLNGARFVHHSSVATFPKESEVDESEVAESEVEASVTSYQLEQNYPNPFNPSTEIAFALPEAGKVTLNIYALTGQLVATLVDGELPAGHHQLSWNGRNQSGAAVAAGVYLYRIVVQDRSGAAVFTESKRMTMLK